MSPVKGIRYPCVHITEKYQAGRTAVREEGNTLAFVATGCEFRVILCTITPGSGENPDKLSWVAYMMIGESVAIQLLVYSVSNDLLV